MTVPSADLTTVHLDASTDDPAQARSELKAAVDKINAIINDLGAGNTVWTNANDGAGSGLDSDLLDGQSSAYYRDAGNINAGTLSTSRLPTVPVANGGTGSTTASGARTNLGLGTLATLSSISASEMQSDSVSAAAIQANAVGSSEIAADAVGSSEIAADAVGQSEIASGAVHQAELDTSTGEVSTTNTNAVDLTLAGGSYGFYPRVKRAAPSDGVVASISYSPDNTSYATNITLYSDSTSGTVYAEQRYINSSPPFDMGDGDVPIFIFVRVTAVGDVVAVYSADVPPWAYNGPTNITGKLDKDGNKYQYRRKVIDRESGKFELEKILITNEIKNADMDLIPHPFASGVAPGESIVLLDPPETEKLLLLHESGESINELLHAGDLRIDNSPLVRATPTGVTAHGFRWR